LIGPVGQKLQNLLNSKIKTPSLIDKDEIHLILEYHAKEQFDGIESPTANRFIVSHDIYNSEMMMIEQFFESIREYEPDLVILSGLHMLENQSPITRFDKLLLLKDNFAENHDFKNVIHLELASIGDKALMKAILDAVSRKRLGAICTSGPQFRSPIMQNIINVN
jgi:ADP-dependent glucokinase